MMNILKNKSVLLILFGLLGLASAYAQSKINVHWEIQNYYIDMDNLQVEVFLSLNDGQEKKVLVAFEYGEAYAISTSGEVRVVTYWKSTDRFQYSLSVDKGSIKVVQEEFQRIDSEGHAVFSSARNIQNIPIAPGKSIVFQDSSIIIAKELYHRPMSLQAKRMNGDDVWALQRFLILQGFPEVGEVDGWFGPNTEKAVRRFQSKNNLKVDGVAGQEVWNVLSGLEEEEVHPHYSD